MLRASSYLSKRSRAELLGKPAHRLGDARSLTRALALAACLVLAAAGVAVLAGAGPGAALAVLGAGISLFLVALTFNPWLLGAVAIDVAIAAVALG